MIDQHGYTDATFPDYLIPHLRTFSDGRIRRNLFTLWVEPRAFRKYLEDLMVPQERVDSQGKQISREGFPEQISREIFRLYMYHTRTFNLESTSKSVW